MMDESLRVALGMPKQPRALVAAVDLGLRLRAKALRFLAAPRAAAYERVHPTYPNGYQLDQIGPSKMLDDLNQSEHQGAVRCLAPRSRRPIYEQEHEDFRKTCRAFMEKEVVPHHEQWEKDGQVSREVWLKAGEAGLLCFDVEEEYGGAGMKDFRFNMVLIEEITRAGASGVGFPVHNDVIVPYISHLGTPEQKQRWLPGLVSGELISAIAMTEPGAGSDLQGIRTSAVDKGDHYVVNGSKTFISNGIMSDLVIVVARTNPDAGHQGISLIVVERGMEGFERGRNLEKVGLKAQDTAELFFDNVAGAQGEPARRRGLRLRLADGEPAPGAGLDRGHRGGGVRARPRAVPVLRQGAPGVRQADRLVPAQPVPARRDGDRGPHRAGVRQRLRDAS